MSVTTASTAMSGHGRVSQGTRNRVQKVATELGYAPNPLAQHLRHSTTGAIGLLLPRNSVSTQWYMEFAFGVVDAAQADHMSVLLVHPASGDRLDSVSVDGFVLPELGEDPRTRAALCDRRPTVMGDTESRADGIVLIDHRQGIRALLDHLGDAGARNVLLLVPRNSGWPEEVTRGYARWCEDTGVPERVVHVSPSDDPLVARMAMLEKLREDPDIDAVVPVHLGLASSLLDAFVASVDRRRIMLASYVDSPELEPLGITAVDLRPRAFGSACATELLRLISGRPAPAGWSPVVTPTVTVRASTTPHTSMPVSRSTPMTAL